ncbi:putative enoyl-CoA hydratase [Nymphon striatum]|nr:putative enoyl-CoA hydratase [Nymphon striatum]
MELKATSYQVQNRVGIITLDKPERGNAWTGRMDTEYRWCLQQADDDPGVRVIVVNGAGKRFCVGGDSQALEGHVERGSYDRGLADEQASGHFGLSKPIIAAVHGAAAGIGLALFTTAHGKLGLPAEYGLSWLLPRIMGTTRAMELLLSSRVFLADEALDLGFVNEVCTEDELLPRVLAYAEELASSVAPTSLQETRRQVYLDMHRPIGDSVAESLRLLNEMMATAEYPPRGQSAGREEATRLLAFVERGTGAPDSGLAHVAPPTICVVASASMEHTTIVPEHGVALAETM